MILQLKASALTLRDLSAFFNLLLIFLAISRALLVNTYSLTLLQELICVLSVHLTHTQMAEVFLLMVILVNGLMFWQENLMKMVLT